MNTCQLESRIVRLERQNFALLASVLGVVFIALFTAARSDIPGTTKIKAHRFALIDNQGKEVAYWGEKDGYAELVFDRNHQVSVPPLRLYEEKDASGARFYSGDANQAWLFAQKTQGAQLSLVHYANGQSDSANLACLPTPTLHMQASSKALLSLVPGSGSPIIYEVPNANTTSGVSEKFVLNNDAIDLHQVKLRYYDENGAIAKEWP